MSIRDEAMEVLIKKAVQIFGAAESDLSPDTRFEEDLKAKSVNYVQFSAALEDEFDIEVPYMEFKKKKTFGEAADYMAAMFDE